MESARSDLKKFFCLKKFYQGFHVAVSVDESLPVSINFILYDIDVKHGIQCLAEWTYNLTTPVNSDVSISPLSGTEIIW